MPSLFCWCIYCNSVVIYIEVFPIKCVFYVCCLLLYVVGDFMFAVCLCWLLTALIRVFCWIVLRVVGWFAVILFVICLSVLVWCCLWLLFYLWLLCLVGWCFDLGLITWLVCFVVYVNICVLAWFCGSTCNSVECYCLIGFWFCLVLVVSL